MKTSGVREWSPLMRKLESAWHKLAPHVTEPRFPHLLDTNGILSKGIFAFSARISTTRGFGWCIAK
jgi:hypothetical protein